MKAVTGLLVLCCTFLCASSISINNLITLRDLRRGYCRGVKQIPRRRFGRAFGPCFSSLPEVQNAVVGEEFRVDGVPTVTVTCNQGYLFPDLKASRNMTYECEKWRVQEDCVEVSCEAPTAGYSTNDPDDETFPHLATVQVTCNPGYVLQSDGTSTTYTAECMAWGVWNNTEACTRRIVCPTPTPNNAVVSPPCAPYIYEDMITVTCNTGYETNSTAASSYTSVCGSEGSFGSMAVEDCTIKFCTAPTISYATLSLSGPYPYDTSVTVTCDAGHTTSSNGKTFTISCSANTNWTNIEQCIEVICPTPMINNGAITTGTPPFRFDDTITVTCDTGYELSDGTDTYNATCLADATFDKTESCRAQICNAEARTNTKLKDGSLPVLLFGTILTVNCADGFLTSAAETSYDVICEAGGVWNDTDNCTNIAAAACPETAVYNTMQTDDVIPFSFEDTVEIVTCTGAYTTPDGSTTYNATCEGGAWDNTWSCGVRTCQDAKDNSLPSGVYKIFPDTAMTEMEVYCDNDYDGGGWTVIQQRVDRSVDFNRPWSNYTTGFGDPNGNFWLGLENMHLLTNSAAHKLDIILEDVNEGVTYAHYGVFSIGDLASMYKLSVSSYTAGSPDPSDNFGKSDGTAFSTYDMDNDGGRFDCAIRRSGAWWFPPLCGQTNLNGVYYPTGLVEGARGLYWRNFPIAVGVDASLIYSRMLVKLSTP